MAVVTATLDEPLDAAAITIRRVAAEQKYAYSEAESDPRRLVFVKGMSLMSWGSKLVVETQAAGPTATTMTITTAETFALTDWGRGKRVAGRLISALGARPSG